MNSLRKRVFKAIAYAQNGDPIKDALDQADVEDALFWLHEFLMKHPGAAYSPAEKEMMEKENEQNS